MKRFLPILFVLPLLLAACEQPTEKQFPNHDSDPIWKLISEDGIENNTFNFLQCKCEDGMLNHIDIRIDTSGTYSYPFVLFGGRALAILSRTEDGKIFAYDIEEYPQEIICESFPAKQQLKYLESQSATPITSATYIYSMLSNISITSDNTLFGEKTGSNLIDKFDIYIEQPRIDYQTLDISEDSISAMDQNDGLFEIVTSEQLKGSLLPKTFFLKPNKTHEERYDQVTLYITIESIAEGKAITRTKTLAVDFE